jgi:hypothetical protein
MPNKLLFGGWAQPVDAKTAAYSVKERDCGKLFTNRGAGASVTFTLPKITPGLKGFVVEFYVAADQQIVIASSPADTLGVHNDLTADTITIGGASGSRIGNSARVICDGTSYLVISNPSAASAATAVTAVTIAT